MKSFETNKISLIVPLVLSAIFLVLGIVAPFFPSENPDTVPKIILMIAFITFGLVIGIGGIVNYIKESRNNKALNDFIQQCGKNAVAVFSTYIKTNDPQVFESVEKALKNHDTSTGLSKMVKVDTTIHYAIICDDGIYFIPFRSGGNPQNNTFYKRGSLPLHTVTVNDREFVIVSCPEIKMLFGLTALKTTDLTKNDILERLNDLYGNTVQKDDIF